MKCIKCESDCHVQKTEPEGVFIVNIISYSMGALVRYKCSKCMTEWFVLKGAQ